MLLGLGGGSGRLRAEATVSAASHPVLVCVCEVRVCARAPSAARPGARSALGGSTCVCATFDFSKKKKKKSVHDSAEQQYSSAV